MSENGSMRNGRDGEIERLQTELEQCRTAARDAQTHIGFLEHDIERLTVALRERDADKRLAETLIATLRERLAHSAVSIAGLLQADDDRSTLRDKLRQAGEELNLLTNEVDRTKDTLARVRQEIEAKIEGRTRELSLHNILLEESQERLRLAIQAAEAGIWDWRIPEDRLEWSPECRQLHGLDESSTPLTLETWLSLVEPDDRQRLERKFRACLGGTQDDFRCEYRVLLEGDVRWFLSRGALVDDGLGHPQRMVGLTIDMTRRKASETALAELNEELNRRVDEEVAAREQAQQALFQNQKLEALGKLTGGFAHDFNNLLMVISSGLDLMLKTSSDERRRLLVERIQQATRRGVDNTRRLLAFGRRQELKPERIELVGRLSEFRDLMAQLLEPQIEVRADNAAGIWPIYADPAALEMALLNLAMNARDAMPRGGTLTLSCINCDFDAAQAAQIGLRPGTYVELAVRDTGHGMSPEVQRRASEPFFTTKGPQQGTGLGLPQVYGFTQQSDGTLQISSAEGAGTTISLYLPRCDLTLPRAEPQARPTAQTTVMSILLVEDDPDVGAMVEELLSEMGHTVTRVSDAIAAIDRLTPDAPYQLLFTDVVLPGDWSGLDLAKRVAARRPDMPVVLTTGYTERFDQLGLTPDFPLLRKPYTPERLQQTIEHAFRQRRPAH